MVAIAALLSFPSCNNEDAAREEANASVVNIEKGVASPVWTSDGESPLAEEGKPVAVPEVRNDDVQEIPQQQPEVVQEPVASTPKPTQEAAPVSEEKSSAEASGDSESD